MLRSFSFCLILPFLAVTGDWFRWSHDSWGFGKESFLFLQCIGSAIRGGQNVVLCHISLVKEGVMLTTPLLKCVPYLLILPTSLNESFGGFKTTCISNEEQERRCDFFSSSPWSMACLALSQQAFITLSWMSSHRIWISLQCLYPKAGKLLLWDNCTQDFGQLLST